MNHKSILNRNKKLLVAIPIDNIQTQVDEVIVRDRNSFLALFHLLIKGKPITNHEQMYVLFQVLKVKNNLHHHWSNSSGWEMANAIKCLVLNKTKKGIIFVSLFCDKVNTVDYHLWINTMGIW